MLNLAALLLADGASAAFQSWSFTVSVTDDTELSTGIPVNLYGQEYVTMAVNWGDGSTSVLTSDDYSALSDMEASIHTYSEAGEYTVTLTSGDWNDFYFETNSSTSTGSDTGYYALCYFRKTLISVDTSLPEVAGTRYRSSWTATSATKYAGFYYMFCGCSMLTSLPENLFVNNEESVTFRGCFYNCSGLASVPGGLFANNTAVMTFLQCFYYCSGLTSVPEDLFASNTAVTSFQSCFYYCSGLASVPEGLFANNTAVTTFASCFSYCSGLTSVPENLFASNTAVTSFQSCFSYCSGLASVPENLFASNTAVTTFTSCFWYCSGLTSVPENLFASNTAVTSFTSCFYLTLKFDCSIRIGSGKVTTAGTFMASSSAYDRYIYVPAGSTTADTFNALSISGMTVVEE